MDDESNNTVLGSGKLNEKKINQKLLYQQHESGLLPLQGLDNQYLTPPTTGRIFNFIIETL